MHYLHGRPFFSGIIKIKQYINQLYRNTSINCEETLIIWTTTFIYRHELNNKNSLLDYKLCVCLVFSLPVQTPDFYAKSRSLYAEFFVLLSKWPDFYAKFLV